MARNIEIKAHIESIEGLASKAAALASEGPIEIPQDDTFFRCEAGRLKLRVFSNGTGELIFYRRANQQGPKESFYLRSPTSAPDTLRESLSLAYGQVGRVRKHRTLFLVGRTRVHLDIVEGFPRMWVREGIPAPATAPFSVPPCLCGSTCSRSSDSGTSDAGGTPCVFIKRLFVIRITTPRSRGSRLEGRMPARS